MPTLIRETQVMVLTGTYVNGDTIAAGTSYDLATLTFTETATSDSDLKNLVPGEGGLTWALDGVDLGTFSETHIFTNVTVGGQFVGLRGFSYAGATYFFAFGNEMEDEVDITAHSTIDSSGSVANTTQTITWNEIMPGEDALRYTGTVWFEDYDSGGTLVDSGLRDILIYDRDNKTSFVDSIHEQQIRSPEFTTNHVDDWGTVTVTHTGGVLTGINVLRTIENNASGDEYHYLFDEQALSDEGVAIADIIGITNFVSGAEVVWKWEELGMTQHARDFQGTERTDDIVATDLDDTFYGNGGDDTMFGVRGADSAFGGNGDDTLYGEAGQDDLNGDAGLDALYGGGADDTLRGGTNADVLSGGNGDDSLFGETGQDEVFGGSGNDLMHGGDGYDTLEGGGNSDTLYGGNGNDTLSGQGAADVIYGGFGVDDISGGGGDDDLYGGGWNDSIDGGEGADTLNGGFGKDTLTGGTEGDLLYGGDNNDDLKGGRGADTLFGDGGSDTLLGQKGLDMLYGGDGVDRLEGAEGDDYLEGGAGADTFVFDDAANLGDDTLSDWEDGTDIIEIAGGLEFNDLAISYTADALIEWNGNTITLTGITSGLDKFDFNFI